MDFRDFTSSAQFDQAKINQFVRLENIPGFMLLRSEREYLECYRACLLKESGEKQLPYGKVENAEEEVKPTKKTRKKAETVKEEEPVSE